MEDILKFLLVVGFLAFGFVKQAKKETASKHPGEGEPTPMPYDTCDDPILEVSPTPEMMPQEVKKPKRRHSQAPHAPQPPKPATSPALDESHEEPDYQFHSLEEARKAIIWSEILHRKY